MRFLELREALLDDKGLPDLKRQCTQIVEKAKEVSSKFQGQENDREDCQGLQDERLMKQKHLAILSENMHKLNPAEYKKSYPETAAALEGEALPSAL